MSGSYPLALRKRVIVFMEEGGSRQEACRVLGVCAATLSNWLRRHRETGSVEASPRHYRVRKVDKVELLRLLEATPDATLQELADHFATYPSVIDYHLRKHKITRKKNHAVRGAGRGKKGSLQGRNRDARSG